VSIFCSENPLHDLGIDDHTTGQKTYPYTTENNPEGNVHNHQCHNSKTDNKRPTTTIHPLQEPAQILAVGPRRVPVVILTNQGTEEVPDAAIIHL
jgi:hypothetical protein